MYLTKCLLSGAKPVSSAIPQETRTVYRYASGIHATYVQIAYTVAKNLLAFDFA